MVIKILYSMVRLFKPWFLLAMLSTVEKIIKMKYHLFHNSLRFYATIIYMKLNLQMLKKT